MKLRFVAVFAIAVLVSQNISAQKWLQNLPKEKSKREYTLFDYRDAFNNYWDKYNVKGGYYYVDGVKHKARGWKQFYRWYWDMETKIDPSTGQFPATTAEEQFNLYYAKNPAPKSSGGNWIQMGPNSSSGGYAGVGRLNCIAFHPSNNSTYWVGAPAGGLWVTTNGGSSWTCLTDDNEVMGVSDIVIAADYATSQTIYIATGDKDAWDNNCHGVLKSTDGGATWNATGLIYTPSDYVMVNRLLADPNNVNTIIAATTAGVYKTTNGGANWSFLASHDFKDMEYKPGNFNTLYGSNTSGGVLVSTNGGVNWTQTLGLEEGQRTELAVSANQASIVYAVVANYDSGLYGVYKSTNSGASFSQVLDGSTQNLLGWEAMGNDSGGQAWYDLTIAASPTNANTVLVGGINTWKSTDGGYSWSIANHWWGDGVQDVHADKHMLNYRANGDLFECNDGGVYFSSNNGTSWTDKTNGIITSQMYKLSNSATDEDIFIAGLQDNGTKLYYHGDWYDVKGGDGMECLIDYSNSDIQYGTYVCGQIDRTTDMWSEDITDISPDGNPDGAWVTPYIIDPVNPQILYVGYSDVYKTTNRGNSWTMISNVASEDKIRSMAIAPSNTQVLYIADNTTIWKTTNGGTTWTDITGSLPVSSAYIGYIAIKNNDPNTVWVTMSGFSTPGVYQTVNGGTTWTNISGGLPTIPVNTIVQNKLNTGTVELYCGTDYGVYFKNGSNNWVFFNNGLPKVKIGELEIWYGSSSATSKLRAATYGRGLWESDLFSSSNPVAGTASAVSPVCSGNTSTLTLTGSSGNIQWEQSANGTSGWANVTGGSGANSTTYTTAALSTSLFFRASLSQTGFTTVYSNVVQVVVNALPSAAGTISGNSSVCKGQSIDPYTVNTVSGADSYVWTLPSGATGTSTTNSISVTYGQAAQSGNITVAGHNTCGNGVVSSLNITVNSAPELSFVVVPESYAGAADGSITMTIDGGTVPYSIDWVDGTHGYSISTLSAGDYSVEVTDVNGCTVSGSVAVTVATGIIANNNIEIEIYPNPAKDVLRFDCVPVGSKIQIFDLKGSLLQTETMTNDNEINVSALSAGTYIVIITTTSKEAGAKKFVKE